MIVGLGIGLILLGVVIYDLTQTKHAILRNFPLIGHLRYLLERVGLAEFADEFSRLFFFIKGQKHISI